MRKKLNSLPLIAILTIYFSTILNLSLWRYVYNNLEIANFRDFCFILSFCFFIAAPLFWLFNLITLPKIGKPLIIFLLLLCSATNFMMFKYGIYIDKHMIQNVMETNVGEAMDLFTFSLVFWVFVTGVIPSILLLFVKIQYKTLKNEVKARLKNFGISLLIAALLAVPLYKDYAAYGRNHRQIKNIINIVNFTSGTFSYFRKIRFVQKKFVELDPNPQNIDYKKSDKMFTVVLFVVGETARAANFSLDGYERKTNPLLEKQDIAFFKDVYACGTSTSVSVPCMFSHMDQNSFDTFAARNTENLLDLAKKSGYQVIWLENDDGCKRVCKRLKHVKNMEKIGKSKYCHKDFCWDEVLLEDLDDILPKIKQNTLIVLHTHGSHGPTYYLRYPDRFKKFLPTCDTADIQDCSLNEIVNTYDNTILYTDYIISSAIDILKQYPRFESSLIYVSDHGESLGEKNIYLHGMPYKIAPIEQKSVPMLIWMNENMKKWDYIDYQCLKKSAEKTTYSHDNIFHSMLGLLAIKTTAYNKDFDLFKDCRKKTPPFMKK